jgi:hypothetical protein
MNRNARCHLEVLAALLAGAPSLADGQADWRDGARRCLERHELLTLAFEFRCGGLHVPERSPDLDREWAIFGDQVAALQEQMAALRADLDRERSRADQAEARANKAERR